MYGRADCLNALDKNNGNLDKALLELEMKALEPIRRRVLRTEDDHDGRHVEETEQMEQKFNAIVASKAVSSEVILFKSLIKSSGVGRNRAEFVSALSLTTS